MHAPMGYIQDALETQKRPSAQLDQVGSEGTRKLTRQIETGPSKQREQERTKPQ